ncbi:dihydropteroate synthase [Halohasta salina]|uniref:dihydropteroate synthase n=1 Tax=Halohasta salina TaxID=2961621 RepID=UPI0020A3AC6A|nr:dihydropteroate synthase [Halohasta salina]
MRTVDAAGLKIGDDQPPRIMGVLNVSSESPYKPSVFNSPSEAAAYVDEELIDEGADIVDVGLESANKKFEVLSAEEELDRLDTALETIESVSGDAVFSIETRYHEVAEAALRGGFDMVNDICGFADPKMPEICEEYDVAVAKMASPPDLERPGAVEDVDDIYEALELNGLTDKTIVDPAFGGWSEDKTIEDDRETFHRLREFRGYGQPILVSINRKNFLRSVAGRDTEGALPVSLAATSMAVERGAHVIRTHDVAETRDAALIGHEFGRPRLRETVDGIAVEELDVTRRGEARRHLDRLGVTENVEAIVDRSVTRVFELSGMDADTHDRLAAASEAAGVDCVSRASDSPVVLVGTKSEYDRLTEALAGGSDGISAVVERIRNACC